MHTKKTTRTITYKLLYYRLVKQKIITEI